MRKKGFLPLSFVDCARVAEQRQSLGERGSPRKASQLSRPTPSQSGSALCLWPTAEQH